MGASFLPTGDNVALSYESGQLLASFNLFLLSLNLQLEPIVGQSEHALGKFAELDFLFKNP